MLLANLMRRIAHLLVSGGLWVLAGACGSVGTAGPPSARPTVMRGPERESKPSAPARTAGETGGRETSSRADQGCADVCADLEQCAKKKLPECRERCERSRWVDINRVNCLALRVYWINEEGCGKMLDTYEHFRADDCVDLRPPRR